MINVDGRARALALTLAAALVASSCGGGTPERADVLGDLAADTIVPTYEALAVSTADLATATEELCASPSADSLGLALDALESARASWSESEAVWVGPVMERRSWAVIDWPIDPVDVEALISDTSIELDNDRLSRRIAADQRGLGAIEYILGAPDDAADTLGSLDDARRCDYLTGVAVVVADEAALLPLDWTVDFEEGGPWADTFVDPAESALDQMVNDALFLLEAMADGELGRALGEMGDGPDPDAIVEGPSGLAANDLAGHLVGLRRMLVGESGDAATTEGLSPLLGDDLTERLVSAFDNADTAVAAIDGPLVEASAANPDTVLAARVAITEVQTLVATEVVSHLGVTIGFSDADGDSG